MSELPVSSCLPDGISRFCVTQGLPVGVVFQFQPTYDLSRYTEALFTVKEYLDDDPTDQAAVITTNGIISIPEAKITVTLTEAQTEALLPGRFYWYDLVLTDEAGPAAAISVGRFSVSPTVTNRS